LHRVKLLVLKHHLISTLPNFPESYYPIIHSFSDKCAGTWITNLELNQVCCVNLHLINKWSQLSSSSKQRGQMVSKLNPFLFNLHLVGNMSLVSLQRKFFTLWGAFNLQTAFQISWPFVDDVSGVFLASTSLIRWWADLTEKLPLRSQCQTHLSLGRRHDKGILRIWSASNSEKISLIRCLF